MIYPEGAAHQSRLVHGDEILMVDGTAVGGKVYEEVVKMNARQPSEVSATTAGRLNKAESNRLWKEQAVWRAENPNSWWQSVPRTWIRPLVFDQAPVITPGPSLSQGAH